MAQGEADKNIKDYKVGERLASVELALVIMWSTIKTTTLACDVCGQRPMISWKRLKGVNFGHQAEGGINFLGFHGLLVRF